MRSPTSLVLRTSDYHFTGLHSRELRHAASAGRLSRVVAGVYVPAIVWATLTAVEKYVARIHVVASRLTGPVVVSHWSAAAIWGFPVPDGWPAEVQIIDPRRRSSTSRSSLHRRPGEILEGDTSVWQGVSVTTPARTASDLALVSPFDHAVMVFDHGLRLKLFTKEQVARHLEKRPEARRSTSAFAALAFADPRAEWPGESFSRCGISLMGLPAPILQHPFCDRRGKIGTVDFYWPDSQTVGEFDGDWKYTDPRFMNGRTAAQVGHDERVRAGRLEAHPEVDRVVRWGYAIAKDPPELAGRLLAGGVVRSHPPKRRRQHA